MNIADHDTAQTETGGSAHTVTIVFNAARCIAVIYAQLLARHIAIALAGSLPVPCSLVEVGAAAVADPLLDLIANITTFPRASLHCRLVSSTSKSTFNLCAYND